MSWQIIYFIIIIYVMSYERKSNPRESRSVSSLLLRANNSLYKETQLRYSIADGYNLYESSSVLFQDNSSLFTHNWIFFFFTDLILQKKKSSNPFSSYPLLL